MPAWIQAGIEYRYGTSDASTDAVATLERGAGVCRDFAHVGIAMTRAMRIPARMVVGYLLGLEPMDLHAWFEAYVGGVAFISNYGPLETVAMQVWVEIAPPPR